MKAFASSGLARKTGPSSSSHAHASSQIARGVIYAGALFTTLVLLGIVGFILVNGVPHLTPTLFEWSYTSENVSLMPALISTLYMALLALLIAVPIGVSSAIYLVEYAKPGSRFVRAVRVTTETLQGIPSIIYGLFGMLFFTTVLGWGLSLLSGACTLAIMVLPVVMRTAEEALIAVSASYRAGGFALGAGYLRTIFRCVLPSALPGIVGGVLLALVKWRPCSSRRGPSHRFPISVVRAPLRSSIPVERWRSTCMCSPLKGCISMRPTPLLLCCWCWSRS